MTDPLTLTGYLGKAPQRRQTRTRTSARTVTHKEHFVFEYAGKTIYDADDVLEDRAEYDVTSQPRTYTVLSLATHHWEAGGRVTTWHRIVAWNSDRDHRGIHFLRKGDQVQITGRPTTFETVDGRSLRQIELTRFRVIRAKPRVPCEPTRRSLAPVETTPDPGFFITCEGHRVPLAGAPILSSRMGR